MPAPVNTLWCPNQSPRANLRARISSVLRLKKINPQKLSPFPGPSAGQPTVLPVPTLSLLFVLSKLTPFWILCVWKFFSNSCLDCLNVYHQRSPEVLHWNRCKISNTIIKNMTDKRLKNLKENESFRVQVYSVQFSLSVLSDSLQPHGLQHATVPCPPPIPGACSKSCLWSWWCHPTISFSVITFSCLQFFPASGSFLMS